MAACASALRDPTDLQAYDEIVRLVRRDIELAVVTESQLLALIDRVYRRTEQITVWPRS
jgi:MSHA biogenesis protein MshE